MPYAPSNSDISGQILAEGAGRAAGLTLQGYQNLSKGIESAGKSAAQGLSNWMLAREERDKMQGSAEMLHRLAPDQFNEDWLSKFSEAPLGKQRAMVSQGNVLLEKVLLPEIQFRGRLQAERDMRFQPELMNVVDDVTGKQYPMVTTSNRSAIPLQTGAEERPQRGVVQQLADGSLALIDPVTGQAKPVQMGGQPVQGRQSSGGLLDQLQQQGREAEVSGLRTRLAELNAQIANRGADAKAGIWPWSKTLAEERDAVLARLSALESVGGSGAGVMTPVRSDEGGAGTPGGGGAASAAAGGGLPRVTSQAEYEALPSGAEYVDGAGRRRRKK